MKSCELCDSPARMYCDSDQARLCYYCDSKVHGANFLVARHTRSLLCQVCQSPTPWSASGVEFGPAMSVCRRCAGEGAEESESGPSCEESEDADESEIGSEIKRSVEEEEDLEEGEMSNSDDDDSDGDIQVVPWTSTIPPPGVTISSASYECSSRRFSAAKGDSPIALLKRSREISSDLQFQECREGVERRTEDDGAGNIRPLKDRKIQPITRRSVQMGPG